VVDPYAVIEGHRPLLFSIAYRMLGNFTAAHAFPLEDNLANMVLLGIAVLLPLILLFVAPLGTRESSGHLKRPDR
jgi:hypothetical protein